MNQSAQLWEVERFLESSVEISEDEGNASAANITLRHRMLSSAQMIRLLRSSNTTFTSDWAGVASNDVRKTLDSQVKQQQELLKIYDEAQAGEPETAGEIAAHSQDQQTREPNRRLQEVTRALPAAALPNAQPTRAKAVTTTQFPEHATEILAEGIVILRVHRAVDNVSGFLTLRPSFISPPEVTLTLLSSPQGAQTAELTVRVGAPTCSRCPIHLTRNGGGKIAVGDYEIHYQVRPAQPHTPPPQLA